jgi:hypothetical protein
MNYLNMYALPSLLAFIDREVYYSDKCPFNLKGAMNSTLFWDVTPYNLVGSYRHFEGMLANCHIP